MILLVTPAGLEPATCPLGGGCSIQLSHGTTPDLHAEKCVWFQARTLGRAGLGKEKGGVSFGPPLPLWVRCVRVESLQNAPDVVSRSLGLLAVT